MGMEENSILVTLLQKTARAHSHGRSLDQTAAMENGFPTVPLLLKTAKMSTISVTPSSHAGAKPICSAKQLQGMVKGDCVDRRLEKKRRLRVDQVKALEDMFEFESKLEPETKLKLAKDLNLKPRQVSIWFQNRRARSKTKQLETDFKLLKANYDALKSNVEALKKENQSLFSEIAELKLKVEANVETESSEAMILPSNSKDVADVKKHGSSDCSESSAAAVSRSYAADKLAETDGGVSCLTETSFHFSDSGYEPEFIKIEDQNLFDTVFMW